MRFKDIKKGQGINLNIHKTFLHSLNKIIVRFYYFLKPIIPRRLQILMRRKNAILKRYAHRDTWPIDQRSSKPPDGWSEWPDHKKFALVLTHDVDTAKGQDRCYQLMKLEESMDFKSSFYFVPERYKVSR